MSFRKADNWDDYPWIFDEKVHWKKIDGPGLWRFQAWVRANDWKIRLNDFPDEPLMTLVINGEDVIHFNEWPAQWWRQPS